MRQRLLLLTVVFILTLAPWASAGQILVTYKVIKNPAYTAYPEGGGYGQHDWFKMHHAASSEPDFAGMPED